MEYDNDRVIKSTPAIEIAGWIFFVLLQPLVNSLGIFPRQPSAWLVILTANILLLPLYMIYAKLVVPRLLFTKRYPLFGLFTFLFFLTVHALLVPLYAAASPLNENYFKYSAATIARETSWLLVNACLAICLAYLHEKVGQNDQLQRLQKENTFYKLRYFRTQLNPHFLFNTLNSIYSLSLNNTAKTPEVIIRLADIMRFLIYECNEEKIPLEKEIDFIQNYIEIERMRYDADIQFTVEGNPTGISIEPFLFISFIENGFKHAIDNSFDKPFIYITLKVNPHQVTLNVINNTSFELEAQAKKIRGRGLENSKSVLELLYPEAYALDIIQTEKKQRKESKQRLKNAQERLQRLYPDNHTLDVILSNNTFTVSLIVTTNALDKMHYHRR